MDIYFFGFYWGIGGQNQIVTSAIFFDSHKSFDIVESF